MLTRILAPILCALLAVASACDQQSDPVVIAPVPAPAALSAPTPPKPADSKLALDWCDVVAADPDSAVVTDAAHRDHAA